MRVESYTAKDHTFVICAYGESKYLGECVDSLLVQSVKSNIIISTSTPNDHIREIAGKYGLELRISENPSSISGDWNFAYRQAKTRLITLAHQDDIYLPDYLSTVLEMINKAKRPIIFFSHYAVIRSGEVIYRERRLNVRRTMLKPLKMFKKSIFIRRRLLSLANIICCPSVVFVDLGNVEFSSEFKCCLDWQKWEELSRLKGSFVYSERPLIYHRIHEDAESVKTIEDNTRREEDYLMLRKFWCAPLAKIILRLYTRRDI